MQAVVTKTDDGVNVYVGGGEKPHIGAIVLSQPRQSLKGDGTTSCTTSVINILGHKDDAVAVPMAEELCRKINQAVVVTCGVHIENAATEEIEEIIKNARELTKKIVMGLKQTGSDPL